MLFSMDEKQLIVYGAPGTGKSFQINEALNSNGFSTGNVIRIVFHKDYSYSDFIGYVSPITTTDNQIEYSFKAGPFAKALRLSLEKNEPVCLLIEELNRGNAPAVFGDTFQLLDRDESGNSSYTIINKEVREYINDNPQAAEKMNAFCVGENDIILPSNLYIIATMNTADQNVFTIDSAFKRRFIMRYMPISFDFSVAHLRRLDSLSKANTFDGKHTWSEFAQMVNRTIDEINSEVPTISEDKKFGPYFVDEIDISSKQAFCDKVILYLKNDVFKYTEGILSKAYEVIYDSYVNSGVDIFDLFKENETA